MNSRQILALLAVGLAALAVAVLMPANRLDQSELTRLATELQRQDTELRMLREKVAQGNDEQFDALARRLAQLQVRLEAAESNWLDCANATISTAATVDALRLSLARPSTAARR